MKTDGVTDASENLNWKITNESYIDEDTDLSYMEITCELNMPITSTDYIKFHVEFYNKSVTEWTTPTTGLFRDGFECILEKQLTTDYWDTTTTDLYVRTSTVDDAATTYSNAVPVDDYNNSVELDGQDWFVYQQDADRDYNADGTTDNLCTASTKDGYACDTIKCVIRRKMVTDDADDFSFTPTEGDSVIMTFPTGFSYIMMNQNDSATIADDVKQRLNTVSNVDADSLAIHPFLSIAKGALEGAAMSFIATFGAFFALTAF